MSVILVTYISKTVTEEEWAPVYEEVKKLGVAFNLGFRKEIEISGIKTICFVPSEEVESETYLDLEYREEYIIDGDLESYRIGERVTIPKNIAFNEKSIEDPIQQELMGERIPDECKSAVVFSVNTHGEPYHLYLTAIATLLEHRFKDKIYVYGDVDREDCKDAVILLKEVLDEDIEILSNCDAKRFCKRIMKTSVSQVEQLTFLYNMCLAVYNVDYGDVLRENFDDAVLDEFFKEQFKRNEHEMIVFLLLGFSLEKLCFLVSEVNKEEPLFCLKMIKVLADDSDFVNLKLGYSKDFVKKKLINAFGKYCDVNQIFEESINSKQKKSFHFDRSKIEKYDISEYAEARKYKKGYTLHPELEKDIGKSLRVLIGFTNNEKYTELMNDTSYSRCVWLSKMNRYLLLRKEHWEKIYKDIQENDESFRRYYPAFVTKAGNENLQDFLRALLINDEFYSYSIELMNKYSEN